MDCLAGLRMLPDNFADSIVTDPPYGLSFMGRKWDYDVPAVEVWAECLRVLKPGGHLLAFAGTRTQHRMAVRIEDAGFEIRDMIAWVYGSGFPKSLDVSKALDKAAGAEREVIGQQVRKNDRDANSLKMGRVSDVFDITAPATDAARQWQGWGTALKPALEPITVARKPFAGTVAENVLEHGTGALNIDGSRVGEEVRYNAPAALPAGGNSLNMSAVGMPQDAEGRTVTGRWPANLIHDGSDEVLAAFPESNGSGAARTLKRGKRDGENWGMGDEPSVLRDAGSGSAARFFYCSKASKSDRNEGCEGVRTWENVDLQSALVAAQQLLKATSDITMLLQADSEWSMTLCGNERTARFLPAIKSTIEIMTKPIMPSTTLNCSAPSITSANIRAAIEAMEGSGLSLAESVEISSPSKLNTTNEKTASALGVVHAALQTLSQINKLAKLGNVHSTVKPTDLMRYLCRLVTPPGGMVLDPFTGSGSTGKAAALEGFRFIGFEREAEYVAIARARIAKVAT